MKNIKYLLYSCYFVLVCIVIASCGEKEKKIDKSLLPGKWKQGTLYEVYKADETGYTWDESDDVTENEAQAMTWTLDKDKLIQYHQMEIGTGIIPKNYTVTELTTTTFRYKDNYGTSRSFTRVRN